MVEVVVSSTKQQCRSLELKPRCGREMGWLLSKAVRQSELRTSSAVRSAQFREPVITGSGVVAERTRYLLD
ncbi:hypothetical protein V6N11_018169 [Hibiscus sabdariffa]|uniref:Uncharacterized protein n=1 Tax=Hibiscus sabdariffa TaxID=183260 RepID=A0ABR2T6K7_9ROSI